MVTADPSHCGLRFNSLYINWGIDDPCRYLSWLSIGNGHLALRFCSTGEHMLFKPGIEKNLDEGNPLQSGQYHHTQNSSVLSGNGSLPVSFKVSNLPNGLVVRACPPTVLDQVGRVQHQPLLHMFPGRNTCCNPCMAHGLKFPLLLNYGVDYTPPCS